MTRMTFVHRFWLVAGLLAINTPLRADDVFASFRNLTPGAGVGLAEKSLAIGRMQFEFRQGTAWPLQNAAGETLGFFFEGKGHYTYRSEEAADAAAFAANLERFQAKIGHSDRSAYDDFERMLVLHAQSPWEGGNLSGPAGPAFTSSAADTLAKMRKEIDRSELGFEHFTAESRLNPGGAQVVYCEIDGAKQRVGHFVDMQRSQVEIFTGFYTPPGVPARFLRVYSRQITPGGSRKREVSYLVDNATFAVSTDDNRSGTIRSVLEISFVKPGQRILSFGLINNRDPKTPSWISESNVLTVSAVTDLDTSKSIPFSHRYNEILIDLGEAPAAGTKRKIAFETSGGIFTGPGGYRDDSYLDFTSIDWYPDPIGTGDARFTFEATIRTKKPYIPVATGETVSLEEKDGYFKLVTKSPTKVRNVAWYSGKYVTHELTTERGLKIRVNAYAFGRGKDREMIGSVASTLMRMLEDQLGPSPYKEIDIVEVPTYVTFGVSEPGLIKLTSTTFKPNDPRLDEFITNHGWISLLAHELAHEWFGHKVMPASALDNWLTESLAEYQSGIAMQYLNVTERQVRGWNEIRGVWTGFAPWCEDYASIEGANAVSGDSSENYRFCLLYNRGPLVLHMLRSWIGDKGYFALLQKFIKDNEFDVASTDDFAKATSQLLRQDMQWFFDDWFRKSGTPTIHVDTSITPGGSGSATLVAKATQADGPGFKRLYIPIVMTMPSGEKVTKMLFQDKPVAQMSFPLPAKPTKVEVDPTHVSLAKFK